MKQNGSIVIAIVIGIIVLAAIGGAYYLGSKNTKITSQIVPSPTTFLTSTPAPSPVNLPIKAVSGITNWQTYTNNKYNYTIKYPSTWFVRLLQGLPDSTIGLENESVILITPDKPCTIGCAGPARGLTIKANMDKNITGLKYFVENEIPEMYKESQVKTEATTIGGQNAFILTGHGGAGCPGPHAYVLKNSTLVKCGLNA